MLGWIPPLFSSSQIRISSSSSNFYECLKVIQIEHGSLAELVNVFLEITKGFSIPAGTIVVMASASSMAMYGTADYAKEFVKANIKLRETF
jgi:hypothetical protein